MKKLILLLTLSLFSITGIFAQPWTVKVSWDASSSNCSCQASINSYFEVSLTIIDIANNNKKVYDNKVQVDLDKDYHVFPVTSVQTYCSDTSVVNIPNFTIYASVGLKCDETNPPEIICSDKLTKTGFTCLDFSLGQIILPKLILE